MHIYIFSPHRIAKVWNKKYSKDIVETLDFENDDGTILNNMGEKSCELPTSALLRMTKNAVSWFGNRGFESSPQ